MSEPARTILFLLRNLYYLRNFEAPIRALAERGHRLVILADPSKTLPNEISQQTVELQSDFPAAITFGQSHGRKDFRRRLVDEIHTARDILRYYTPAFRLAEKLRRRAASKATPLARLLFDRDVYWDAARNKRADRRLSRWDSAMPADRAITERIEAIAPDLLVVTPLVDLRTDQIDWVRAAHRQRIPTALAVASWDNLTSKSRIQVPVDRVLLWNDIQRREAIDLHGVADESIVVTGAQLYDEWFEREPRQDRNSFCRTHRFDPDRPIILYVGSSASITKDEPNFIRQWLARIRACEDSDLAAANILIRPHPMNFEGYDTIDVRDLGRASVSPLIGSLPVTEAAKSDYFDALYHSDLLVGLNTSALVEASIFGKSCHTFRFGGVNPGQHETLHYHYLTAAQILREADSFDQHLVDLAEALHEPNRRREAADRFVAEFLRPNGRDKPATPSFVAAVEATFELTVTPTEALPGLAERALLDATAIASLSISGLWYAILRIVRRARPAASLEPPRSGNRRD